MNETQNDFEKLMSAICYQLKVERKITDPDKTIANKALATDNTTTSKNFNNKNSIDIDKKPIKKEK